MEVSGPLIKPKESILPKPSPWKEESNDHEAKSQSFLKRQRTLRIVFYRDHLYSLSQIYVLILMVLFFLKNLPFLNI